MPAPRSPRRDAAKNRAALLDAARTVLNRDPEAALDAITAEAGLSRRAFYGHFATREELIAELALLGAARVAAAAEALHDDDPVVDLAIVGRLVWDDVEHVRPMAGAVVRGPLRATVLNDPLAPLHARIVRDVERAAAAGTGRDDLPAETVARLVEGAAFTVLDESLRSSIGRQEGRRLVVLAGLGALGLSWREAQEVIAAHPDRLLEEVAR